ncbi:prostate androgen-regulated mucin-like protein 1 [Sciurus carolinensis]|uniref:prostate androgen-regulated mucin-like protein 1 n=1 Tax=Sciurus carolinensis TaxID=30640 RepID=UPI001FB3013D|nr:prostate androgen-regulated mucin-like protein 1 [Sciurus carolinensis]
MVCKTLIALCIFTAGLRVQSLPTSTSLPVSLPAKITPSASASTWNSSAQNPAALTASSASSIHNTSVLPVTASAPTSSLPNHVSLEPREAAITSPASKWEGTNPDPSLPGFSSTSSVVHLTPTPNEHNASSPEVGMPAAGSQAPTPITPQAPASSPSSSSSSASPPEVPSITSNHSTTVTSTQPTEASAAPESPTEEHSSGHTTTSRVTAVPVPKDKTQQETEPDTVICESETTTTFLIMQEVEHALSSGSIAAITVTVIAVVLLVFGVAAYLKIRHSSYGRLLDDHDYGSWGNYNNPLYDDS